MIEKIKSVEGKTWALMGLCLVLALVSFAGLAPVMESPETYPRTIASLDNKRGAVVEMSASLIGVSVVVAAVPGDATTPVANQISQLNSYLIIVLGAIMLVKFLLPVIALLVWRILIPVGLILLAFFIFFQKKVLRVIAIHLFVLGAAMMLLIPFSVKIGDLIDDSFGTDNLLQKISEDLSEMSDRVSASVEDGLAENETGSSSSTKKKKETEKKGILEQITGFGETISDLGDNINELKENINESIANLGSTFTTAAAEAIDQAKEIMGDLMDAVAILLVTVCVIPVVTLLALVGMVKFSFELLLKQLG